jgi:alpha-amylase
MVVGEFYDYNPASLNGYISNVYNGMNQSTRDSIHVRVFDFALRGALKASCDQFGYDVRNLFTAGMVDGESGSGYNAVTFVNNHDFRDAGQPVTYQPELAYAYILTNNKLGKLPCVYYNDYFNSNFMRGRIKGLMHAHQRYIFGATSVDYLSRFSTPYGQYFVTGYANTSIIYQLHNPSKNTEVIDR